MAGTSTKSGGGLFLRPDPPGARRQKWVGRDSVQVDSVRETVISREEVRPMNAVSMWVLPLVFTVER